MVTCFSTLPSWENRKKKKYETTDKISFWKKMSNEAFIQMKKVGTLQALFVIT
jgi:hypothetical protein